MKSILNFKLQHILSLGFKLLFIAFLCCFYVGSLNAQVENKDETQEVTEDDIIDSQLISPVMDFSVIQSNGKEIILKATLKARISEIWKNLHLLKVSFYQIDENDDEKDLGFVITDGRGIASLNLKDSAINADAEGLMHFKAVYSGNKSLDAIEEEVFIKKAGIYIEASDDEERVLNVKLHDSEGNPIAEVPVLIMIRRTFNPLLISEESTDENGEFSIEIPANLQGDAEGNITILARLEEDPDYGTIEVSETRNWGIPLTVSSSGKNRTLWSPSPPLWMTITFIILMVTVWGHYIVILYNIYRIKNIK